VVPSIVFGSNFVNTYFFSGVCCLLMTHLLELYEQKKTILFRIQLVVMVYVVFVLLSARQNFFMDICTALVFTHYVFYFINNRIIAIDRLIFKIYDTIVGNKEE
jgi:Ca2+/Na+ antiporter